MKINQNDFDQSISFKLIYSFHMALFFFLSGEVFKFRPLLDELFLTTKRLLIPFFVFFLVVSCKLNLNVFASHIVPYVLNPQLGFWFFFVLAVIRIFVSLVFATKTTYSRFFVTILIFTFALIQINHFAMRYVLFYIPIFLMGYYFNKYSNRPSLLIKSFLTDKIHQIILLLCLLSLYLMIFPYYHRNLDGVSFSLFLTQKIALAVLGIGISYIVISMINVSIINRVLEFVGRHSMFIYGLHLLFLPLYQYIGLICIIPMILMPIFIELAFDSCVAKFSRIKFNISLR